MSRAGDGRGTSWALRLCRNVLLWLVPVAVVWVVVTPFYNLVVTIGAEHLIRLFERPAVTKLEPMDVHHFAIVRTTDDVPQLPFTVRTTDIHFPLVMMGALFLAVPGVPLRRRFRNLGWALVVAVFFHIADAFLWVKFAYATQLGSWSAENYGPVARTVWGMSKHLMDLPFKLGLPLALWGYFYLGELRSAALRSER